MWTRNVNLVLLYTFHRIDLSITISKIFKKTSAKINRPNYIRNRVLKEIFKKSNINLLFTFFFVNFWM